MADPLEGKRLKRIEAPPIPGNLRTGLETSGKQVSIEFEGKLPHGIEEDIALVPGEVLALFRIVVELKRCSRGL